MQGEDGAEDWEEEHKVVCEKKGEIKKETIRWSIVGRSRLGRRCTTQERSRSYLRLMITLYAAQRRRRSCGKSKADHDWIRAGRPRGGSSSLGGRQKFSLVFFSLTQHVQPSPNWTLYKHRQTNSQFCGHSGYFKLILNKIHKHTQVHLLHNLNDLQKDVFVFFSMAHFIQFGALACYSVS